MSARDWVRVYLKGFAMGTADAVPGVSGGTIALITGIYDRLVTAIAEITGSGVRSLITAVLGSHDPSNRARAIREFRAMDLPFLAILATGVVSAAITAANVIVLAVSAYPGPTYAFFFGLIAASAYVLREELRIKSPAGLAVAAAGFALAFVASGTFQGSLGDGLPMVFFSGAIAICAMVLPGISGSLILLALGQYEMLLGAVHDLTRAILGGGLGSGVDSLIVLVVFAFGALLGILSFARVVAWALDHYRRATLSFLVALMVGALRAPAERILSATTRWTPGWTLVLLVVGVAGAATIIALDSRTAGIEY
ncbi:MAG: DUF368 domain-containing protein [Halanaeroarchaeum sp.]